jgi:hypothetical protein
MGTLAALPGLHQSVAQAYVLSSSNPASSKLLALFRRILIKLTYVIAPADKGSSCSSAG